MTSTGTVNSTEPQALVSADLVEGEGLVDADGNVIEQDPPKPIAALAVDAGLAPGEPVPIVPGPIASAAEGVVPDAQAKVIAAAMKEAAKAAAKGAQQQVSKKELEAQAKELGIVGAGKMSKDKLTAAIEEAEVKAATQDGPPSGVPEIGEGSAGPAEGAEGEDG
jgi:hypothetical protein